MMNTVCGEALWGLDSKVVSAFSSVTVGTASGSPHSWWHRFPQGPPTEDVTEALGLWPPCRPSHWALVGMHTHIYFRSDSLNHILN